MKLSEPIGIRIPQPVKTKLKKIANKKGSKLTPYMRLILTEYAENEG